ncbi:MAG: hypothetical protein HY651_08600 [Acidobacteria bacterium]|nr:hypothetical protein [Acidobacteriota bacterium]
MISSKRISLALAALVLVVLAGAGSAYAQTTPQFNVTTAVPFVANTGRSEVLGQVVLTADVTCNTVADLFCVSTAGTIQVLYVGTPIDLLTFASAATCGTLDGTGIEVTENVTQGALGPLCNLAGTYLTGTFAATNTTAGGVVSFGVTGAVDFAAGDQVVVRGVRGQIDLSPASVVGTSITAQLTTSPSTIAGFSPVQQEVARSADPLVVGLTAVTIIQCRPAGTAVITLTEGFNTAWVDHGNDVSDTGAGHPDATRRPRFGGTNNSRITIVITSRPTGVTIVWPAASSTNATTGASLILVAGSTNDTATYTYHTPGQGLSDVTAEAFTVTLVVDPAVPGVANNIRISGTTNDFGTALAQAQMAPASTSTGSRPRYNHPLENVPAGTLITVVPCTTNLLYPWVLNFAALDTGIAISNTSLDPYGTLTQAGTCAVHLFPTDTTTNNGVNAGGAITVTTQSVAAGSVWRSTLSGQTAWAGKAGYIIAICNFQYGHGFAFITDRFGVGTPETAQGYLALVIPDPVLLGGLAACGVSNNPAGRYRSAAGLANDKLAAICAPPYGEGLTQ